MCHAHEYVHNDYCMTHIECYLIIQYRELYDVGIGSLKIYRGYRAS